MNFHSKFTVCLIRFTSLILLSFVSALTQADEPDLSRTDAELAQAFEQQVQPLLEKYCYDCHGSEVMESGIRVDQLDASRPERSLKLWRGIEHQLANHKMPPEDEPQPNASEREQLITWISHGLTAARSRPQQKNGSIRRLTVTQYQHTLEDLLLLNDHLTDILPPDAISKDGFVNNEQTLELSPLLLETYFELAEKTLDLCIVDVAQMPVIQNFRMQLGQAINPEPCPDELILGANNHLLANADFLVTQLTPEKPFAYDPFLMQTRFRFIEGYQGNDTVRGWREFNSIYHTVFACMRGWEGYPKGRAYETIPTGLLLRPAIPSAEIFDVESTYGPKANFKISLRELPDHGNFRVTVSAAKYNDGLLLDPGTAARHADSLQQVQLPASGEQTSIEIPQPGVYQVDVHLTASSESHKPELRLSLGDRHFSGIVTQSAFLAVRLEQGSLPFKTQLNDESKFEGMTFTKLNETDPLMTKFQLFESRSPSVGVHLGLRRDCGSTLTQVGAPQKVTGTEFASYQFEGAIANYPSPDVEKDNVNYLAGIREIGIRSEETDGRDRPRLLIQSVEFEGPYYDSWPPATHTNLFFSSAHENDPPQYAREIIESFASRAFRRPVSEAELNSLFAVWESAYRGHGNFQQSIKDALLVVLTSPQFLFLIESSETPQAELLNDWELASKLSYFLWNAPPDEQLLVRAAAVELTENLNSEVTRLISDSRFEQFTHEFASQWFNLDKLDVVEIDRKRYPHLTSIIKSHLREEPVQFLTYLIRHDRPLSDFIESDFILANEVVASYYELGSQTESGFDFVPVRREDKQLGGILTQAGILAGLSDGREANPVKRGAWFARKIIAEPPDDPPPNVPALDEDLTQLSLRERLEKHRNQTGCVGCHSGIDPWGVPFEQYDASGRFKLNVDVDATSALPDGATVKSVDELKRHLIADRIDQVAFSYLKHLAIYAIGRSLSENEIEFLKQQQLNFKDAGYPMQQMLHSIVQGPLFLEK